MQARFNVTGKERKAFVKAISEITGATAVYKGVPTCNYEVDYFTIDREGTLIYEDTVDNREIKNLFEELKSRGFEAEAAEPEEIYSHLIHCVCFYGWVFLPVIRHFPKV